MKQLFFSFVAVFLLHSPILAEEIKPFLITEIKVAGISAKDEYVKICNNTDQDQDIKGYRLEKITGTGKTIQPLVKGFEERVIFAGECFVVYHPESVSGGDILYDGSGTIAKDNAVRLLSSNKETIDLVGFGNVASGFYLGSPAPNPEYYQILVRKSGQDTGNNFNDFLLFGEAPPPKEEPVKNPSLAPTTAPNNPTNTEKVAINYQTAKLLISELYPNPTKEEGEPRGEFIEIYNPNNFEVNLIGWSLQDSVGKLNKYIIQGSVIIKPLGYLVIGNPQSKINLNNEGDSVILRDPYDKIIYSTPNYGKAPEGKSYSLISADWQWSSHPTPGQPNKKEDDLAVVDQKDTSGNNSLEVFGASVQKNKPMVLQKEKNSGILFFLAAGIILTGYLAYLNRGEIEKKILYKKR